MKVMYLLGILSGKTAGSIKGTKVFMYAKVQETMEQQEEKIPKQRASYASLRGKCRERIEEGERGLKTERKE